jgi:predicted dehydrogenase
MSINIAFAGVAHIHTPGFINAIRSRGADVKVTRVYDPHPVKAERRAKELGAIVSTVDEIAKDGSIAGVVVCSETNRHVDLVAKLAAAKKHLFVEKPLGMAADDSYAMADAIEKAGVAFQTGYFMRGIREVLMLRKLVQDGSLGKITRARASNCHTGSLGGWFDDRPDNPENSWLWMTDLKQSGVGAFGDLGTHVLDLLIWILGDVQSVTGQLDMVTARYPGCDESGEALLRFKNGAIATLAAGWVDHADPIRLLISGTEGHAVMINGQLHVVSKKRPEFDGSAPLRHSDMPAPWAGAFDLYLDKLAGKEVNLVGAREAAYRSAVMAAIYQAARSGMWVNL